MSRTTMVLFAKSNLWVVEKITEMI